MTREEILDEFALHKGFHWRDGWFFMRTPDGSVAQIRCTPQGGAPEVVSVIDQNSWASIVASVSEGGEADGRYYQALAFHGEVEPTP